MLSADEGYKTSVLILIKFRYILHFSLSFLTDRTNVRAIGTVLRPSVVVCRLYGMYCG